MRVALLLALLAAAPAVATDGPQLFRQHCAGCHKADGTGVPGFGPSLTEGIKPILGDPRGVDYLAQVLVGGLKGPIESVGKRYNGVMPAFGGQSDETLQALLGHVVGTLNGGTPPDAATLAAARAEAPTPAATHALRQELLGGA